MTKNDLVELIKETTLPLVKQFVSGDVADLIRAQVEASVKALRAPAGSADTARQTPAGGRKPGSPWRP